MSSDDDQARGVKGGSKAVIFGNLASQRLLDGRATSPTKDAGQGKGSLPPLFVQLGGHQAANPREGMDARSFIF